MNVTPASRRLANARTGPIASNVVASGNTAQMAGAEGASLDAATADGAPLARERLERAAIELFTQQGFAATTVPQITARAGPTTRLLTEAPPSLDPMTLIVGGLKTVAQTRFEERREEIRERRAIIRSDPGLGERDLRKRAALAEAIRAASSIAASGRRRRPWSPSSP